MKTIKKCSFIGHRKIEVSPELENKLTNLIESLIVSQNVSIFLFGSRSQFDSLCHRIVTSLKEKFPFIKRIAYTCKSEGCTLEREREKQEKIYSNILKKKMYLMGYEEEFEHKSKYTSGRASYVERNMAMIDDSDFVIFYYSENYKPPKRTYTKKSFTEYQPKSGTKIAYEYAKQKKKEIFNLA